METDGIKIVRDTIPLSEVQRIADQWYKTMVKGAVDVNRGVIALGGEWHMDANNVLIGDGSKQEDVWGFNIYPGETGESTIAYTSLINIRPAQDNRSMEVEDEGRRGMIKSIIKKRIPELDI